MTRTHRFATLATLCCATLLAAAGASSAHAYDITGSWVGTYKCKGTFQGTKDSFTEVLTVDITQAKTAVGATVRFDGDPFHYTGIALTNADPKKVEKGDLMLVICGSDDDLSAGVYDELGRFAVTTKDAKGTGKISGTSVFSSPNPLEAYTCKWKMKRTPFSPDLGVATACTL